MLSVQEASSTIFLSLWYDSTWDWAPISRTIGEHFNHHANGQFLNEPELICLLSIKSFQVLLSYTSNSIQQSLFAHS